MRIELTIACRDRCQDVAVEAPENITLARLLPDLARSVGARPDAPMWSGDRLLRADSTFAAAGLRAGSLLQVGQPSHRADGRPGVLSLHVAGGPAAGRIVPLERGRLTIGRAPDCDLVLPDADASRRHALLDVTAGAITLSDLGSTNGTSLDTRPVPAEGVAVRTGALISIGDSLLTVAGPVDAPATLQPGSDGMVLLQRPPRRQVAVPEGELARPVQPTAARPRGTQWITALLPAAAGGALAWFAHAPQFLLFALLSPLMMASTALGDRLHWRRSRRQDAASYHARRAEFDRRIAEGLAAEAFARRVAAPDPATVLRQSMLPSCRVWERHQGDADLLRLRVGTADLPSTLRVRSGSVSTSAGTLAVVPVCVDLRHGPVGVAGPPQATGALARWLVAQLAALHAPSDVQVALALDPERAPDWHWARWLPHVSGGVATSADECGRLTADLAAIAEQRLAAQRHGAGGWRGPWLVLVVDRAGRLAEVPGLGALLARGAAVGLTAVCIDPDRAALPAACATVGRVCGVNGTRLLLHQPAAADIETVIDQVAPDWADSVARALAPLTETAGEGAATVPDDCRLLETLGLERLDPVVISRRWSDSRGGACSVLGRSADGPLRIDLAVDGPHALVAGTTGAGKSELLQTLVAGLATMHPPDEVNLLLIDYKGGAAFADCSALPHTAGLLTDLDPYLTERALRALHSELRRRERLFADVGASDLDGYRGSGAAEQVPRLVIVVDEFAALADELPGFLRGLVGVAQRGRSLGVHLVLATQRPGAAVSAEIRANTSMRIALRVTDPAESTDVIDSPVAASIERYRPGRGYLRTGSALACFQVPHASAVTEAVDPERVRVEPLDSWRRARIREGPVDAPSDLARLVTAIGQAAQLTGSGSAHSPWLAPLPDALPRSALGAGQPSALPIGLVDLPDEQRRAVMTVDLETGSSLLVAGAARSGRTTALVSLAVGAAAHFSPTELNLHLVDATGALVAALRALPHCATVLGPEDLALTPRLLRRLEQETAQRFAGHDAPGRWPRLLLLIDGWDAICAALPEIDAAACHDALTALLRIGSAAGLAAIVTGDRSVLAPRFAGGFGDRVLLRMADRADYAIAGIAARDVPAHLPPGRGMRAADGAVVQFAHPGAGPDQAAVARSVTAAAASWHAAGTGLGPDAIRIRPLPARVRLADLPAAAGRLSIGLAGDRLDPLAFDPFAGAGRLLVAGPPRSGRTTLLRLLAQQAHDAGIATLIAAAARSPLVADARRLDIPVVAPANGGLEPLPPDRTLVLIDDSEAFADSVAGDLLVSWVRSRDAQLAVVVAGRAEDLATSYRGVAAEVRRSQCGILLRPGPIDGELLGVRLPRRAGAGPPGRGVAVGDPCWGALFADGEPVPIQVATP